MNALAEGRASVPLKILGKCVFPTSQRFIWLLLCFDPLHILGSRGKFFLDRNIENKYGVVCRGFLQDGKILYLETKHTFKEIEKVTNKHQEQPADG